jgi:hypothetical protein
MVWRVDVGVNPVDPPAYGAPRAGVGAAISGDEVHYRGRTMAAEMRSSAAWSSSI